MHAYCERGYWMQVRDRGGRREGGPCWRHGLYRACTAHELRRYNYGGRGASASWVSAFNFLVGL